MCAISSQSRRIESCCTVLDISPNAPMGEGF